DLVEKYLKIPKKLLIFMIQVFFDLKFVKLEDGVLSYIENPPKHSLTESQTYQNRLQKIKTEEFFLLSNLETLKNWLIHSQEEH
ncbi:single-stranded-DNA-specific exonuclease C-terminal domain-containing protein, partial [Enterococcus cecorum]|uniref:single-stranded-DNA-specific exonuclease C-terminal domain-containing protein n=1 Tax=Enterococcus cecorum TaxID=44008 RepID=UPI001FAE6BCB